jgi:hypothetical protein
MQIELALISENTMNIVWGVLKKGLCFVVGSYLDFLADKYIVYKLSQKEWL